MDEIEIGRILSSEPEIEPSPEFQRRVLETLRREAAAPAPIPFPWVRLIPALVGLAAVVGGLAVQASSGALLGPAPALPADQIAEVLLALGIAWLAPRFSSRVLER